MVSSMGNLTHTFLYDCMQYALAYISRGNGMLTHTATGMIDDMSDKSGYQLFDTAYMHVTYIHITVDTQVSYRDDSHWKMS